MLTADARAQLETMQEALVQKAQVYEGTSILVPSKQVLAQCMGSFSSQVFNRHNTTYDQKLGAITGRLEIVHRGVLLGQPSNVRQLNRDDLPPVTEPVDIEGIAASIEGLPPAERERLLARFAMRS
jgi:hypothetical protein